MIGATMQKKEFIEKIFLKDNQGREYIVFCHSDKTWFLPCDNIEPALEMYQPSTIKGKILKSCIKLFHNNEMMLEKIFCQKQKLLINYDVLQYLKEIAQKDGIFLAVYMGDTTSAQNRKVTIQIYDNQKILCYAKVTEEPEVIENFEREITSLKYLEGKGIANIPKVLGEKQINGLHIFVQSTEKPLKQQVRLVFEKRQIDFIDRIVKNTKQDIGYESSQFYESVQYLKSIKEQFEAQVQTTINKAIEMVEAYAREGKIEFAFSHGDYTPWNVYYVGQELHAFDFEYCYKSMPAYIDVFHYLTQLSVMGLHNDVERTVGLYKENKKSLKEYISNPDLIYICYLLHIIAFYHGRTNGDLKAIEEKIQFWIELLGKLI